ncbi:MAG: phage/plasmid primase, P4 family [Phycisphaerae bacterium]
MATIIKKTNPYKSFWNQLIQRFGTEPRLSSTTPSAGTSFLSRSGFEPQKLAEVIQVEFDPMAYVEGSFYRFIPEGVWTRIPDHVLGKFAISKLSPCARTSWINDTINLLKTILWCDPDQFQPKPNTINLKNGMLNLLTGTLEPHDPEFKSRVQLPFAYDPIQQCPRWMQFLDEVFDDEPARAKMLQQWMGYCLTEETFVQQFMVFIGTGANGKSVTLSVMAGLVGQANVCAISMSKMAKDFILITLRDKLVNLCAESNTSRGMDSETLKTLTGGDLLTVDIKFKDPVTFRPKTKHTFAVNEMPRFRDSTEALRRRALFIEFNRQFKKEARNPNLVSELMAELSGILVWALKGLEEVMRSKEIFEAPSSQKRKELFAELQNPILTFINEACKFVPGHRVERGELYSDYCRWHQKNFSDHPLVRITFYERIRQEFPAQIIEKRIRGTDYFEGIEVANSLGVGNMGKPNLPSFPKNQNPTLDAEKKAKVPPSPSSPHFFKSQPVKTVPTPNSILQKSNRPLNTQAVLKLKKPRPKLVIKPNRIFLPRNQGHP